MKTLPRLISLGLPSVIGMGVAWLGLRIIRNEQKLAKRKMELEIELGSKALKSS